MRFPFVLIKDIDKETIDNWEKQFLNSGREYCEAIWRRTQDEKNKNQSGWQSNKDRRRKIIYFYDRYGIVNDSSNKNHFALKSPYLWYHISYL